MAQDGVRTEYSDDVIPPPARTGLASVRKCFAGHIDIWEHPNKQSMVRLIRTARCHIESRVCATRLTCPTCMRRRHPHMCPKAALPNRPTRFNHVVGLDLKHIKDSQGMTYTLLNLRVLVTVYNIIFVCGSKELVDLVNTFKTIWNHWAGVPETLVVDKGSVLCAEFLALTRDWGDLSSRDTDGGDMATWHCGTPWACYGRHNPCHDQRHTCGWAISG